MDETLYDVLVLGGGPAGYTASIYTSRAQLKTLNISGPSGSGQLVYTSDVENFPGFPDGIQGPVLIENMRLQAQRFGTKFLDEYATSLSGNSKEFFTVTTESGKSVKGRCVIIATGASANWLGLESEQRLRGKGVSACATCDGFFFKDKEVAVIGGGDAAMEEATFLSKFVSRVHIIIREPKDKLFASKYMAEKAFSDPKIIPYFETEIEDILGDKFVDGVRTRNNVTGEKVNLSVKGVFIAIGHKPNTKFLNNFVELAPLGYINRKEGSKTSVEGVFAAGDVADWIYRQAIAAAGSGCMAALDAEKFLSSLS